MRQRDSRLSDTSYTSRTSRIRTRSFEDAGVQVAPVTRDVDRCRSVDVGRDVVDGYDVTYRFQNRDLVTRLPYHPGDRLQVRVDVQPEPR